jgi:anti-sigma regulatory factor (Ser/Thr protein kinase)
MHPDEQTIHLACEPVAVRDARQVVESQLRRRGWSDDDVERAKLAASELVANAVVHARTEAAMRLRIDRSVRLEVIDGAPQAFPQPRPPDTRRVGGLGLRLVAQVASDWGFETTSAGKSVWCEVEPQRPVAPPRPDAGGTDRRPRDEPDRDLADRRGAAIA